MKRQIFIIHGGDSFKTQRGYLKFLKNYKISLERYRAGKKDWKTDLHRKLGKNFEVFLPMMPNRINAKYKEWELWLNKFIPHMKTGAILIGHSLGGLFLAKYLSNNKITKKISAVFLIATPYNEGDFTTPKSFGLLEKQSGKLFLYQSRNDTIVPFKDLEKYRARLQSAIYRISKNQGHFNVGSIPGLIKDIKNS